MWRRIPLPEGASVYPICFLKHPYTTALYTLGCVFSELGEHIFRYIPSSCLSPSLPFYFFVILVLFCNKIFVLLPKLVSALHPFASASLLLSLQTCAIIHGLAFPWIHVGMHAVVSFYGFSMFRPDDKCG